MSKIRAWVTGLRNRKLDEAADARFNQILDDAIDNLAVIAVAKANMHGLVEDGEFTSLGKVLMDSYFSNYSPNTVPAPSTYPIFDLWKFDVVTDVPDALRTFFAGAAGHERLACMLVFILADVFSTELKHLQLTSKVRTVIASHILEDNLDHWLLSRVKYDGRKAYINYANAFVQVLTLYGYGQFQGSLPKFAADTVPDIRTFIRLRGLKK